LRWAAGVDGRQNDLGIDGAGAVTLSATLDFLGHCSSNRTRRLDEQAVLEDSTIGIRNVVL